ncbi:Cof-type HAD-IIB family hydrolase [Fusobacterium sp.]|uniref:Cof-type HAD-IIB family hydrolase n=1 Tax=Fusobacterium sp. TaxID=68766 RepID=UPI002612C6CC|nr:Cof-type HAD-IIB family hydrolase [Fusobacterium sp.]
MKIKAVALDMDGTLLCSDHKPSERTKQFLLDIEKKGAKVIIATGRSFGGTESTAKLLGLDNGLVLCYNGAKVVNYKDKSVLFERPLAENHVKELIDIADSMGVHINLYQDNVWYVDKADKDEVRFYSNKCGITPVEKSHDSFDSYSMPKVVFIGEHEKVVEVEKEVKKRLGNEVHVAFSSDTFLEVMNKDVNKGVTLKWILEHFGIKEEECAAFGDAENDLEMLFAVKYGVAMGNATDEFKKKLNYTTLSNDEDGIVEFLKEYF